MKTRIAIFLVLLSPIFALAQSPQQFNYQAVVRDASGTELPNQSVSFRVSLVQGSSGGTAVYSETHTVLTNSFGLANLAIGTGTVSNGNFSLISWGNGPYFIRIELDINGGNSYQLMGTSQLLSVPYALYSENTGNSGVDITGSNSNSAQTINYNTTNFDLTDITQSISTGTSSMKAKISGMVRTSASGFSYANDNNLGLVVVHVYLQRATDAAFTTNLTDLQISRCTPYTKIADATSTTAWRVIQTGIPCTIPIEYLDTNLASNTTYYYRLRVVPLMSGQQPTAGTINIQDRALNILTITN